MDGPTDTVKEFYDKIIESVCSKRTMAPNAWTWSMIGNCKNHEDIKLLFDALQNLRTFRLSNLRIHDNFNCHICQEVAKARVGAVDFGKKTLWKHNVYGLTPSVASAHHLLLHAKEHKDTTLMADVMKLLKTNALPLQPGTADIVFSICYNIDNWELLCKYAKAFIKAGVKFRRTNFDIWMDFAAKTGKKTLWKHNVYGLTPSVASAHHLLLHAKEHKDTTLMADVMKLLKTNALPLQPGTADIVFRLNVSVSTSICYNIDNWELLCKYAKAFIKAGVKFRRTNFDIWMDFAAKTGNVQSIWETEKLRSESMKQHTLLSAISCAKGFLLEGKPEEAAAVVNVLNEILPDEKKSSITAEVEKLVSEWPFEVIKRQKPEDRKALAASLQSAIPANVNSLSRSGLSVAVSIGDFTKAEEDIGS